MSYSNLTSFPGTCRFRVGGLALPCSLSRSVASRRRQSRGPSAIHIRLPRRSGKGDQDHTRPQQSPYTHDNDPENGEGAEKSINTDRPPRRPAREDRSADAVYVWNRSGGCHSRLCKNGCRRRKRSPGHPGANPAPVRESGCTPESLFIRLLVRPPLVRVLSLTHAPARYDRYRGVISLINIQEGVLHKGTKRCSCTHA